MKAEATREKYKIYDVPKLKKLAQYEFNAFIRRRDEGKPCVSCGNARPTQAGHYFSAGHYPGLAMNENNCHLQCVRCNMYLSGNLREYREGLIKRIGEEQFRKLEDTAAYYKRNGYKHDRMNLIEIIIKYRNS